MTILTAVLWVIVALAALLILFYKFWFLRDPLRLAPNSNSITAPADGEVIDIRKMDGADKTEIRKGKGSIEALLSDMPKHCYLITIFMTPFNVHYQRAPYDGKVTDVAYTKGKFATAEKPRPENENNQILIKTKIGNMKVIQIAGFIARRIVCFVKKNQNIKKGQKLGLIKLGSQVCLIMPDVKGMELKIKKGDKLKAGETIIASLGNGRRK